MASISNLKQKWTDNSEGYKTKEVGSGVHSFISDILESNEFFNLKKTVTKSHANYTFVHETESGKAGRPDFVLYINKDIIIPVEAKCYGRIEEGITQLYRYQTGFDRQFGILTDGNEWRFYRGPNYRRFMLDNMLANHKDFFVFWTDYTKTENYYIELFNKSGQTDLFESKIDLNDPENRKLFFDDTTRLVKNFKVKMKALGVWGLDFDKIFEKTAVETSYAYLIQFILYKVLVDNYYGSMREEYEAMMRRMQKYVKDEDFYDPILKEVKGIAEYVSRNIYKPFKKEQESITESLFSQFKKNLTIDDIAPWLDIIGYIDKYSFANLRNEIFGFVYENYLKDLYSDSKRGQYFTDPAVVNYMLQEIGYAKKALIADHDKISIIDPSCGAGTFLYSATDRIISAINDDTLQASRYIKDLISKNIFGLDIEEFPLYLAEMSILMRLLPLIVNDKFKNPVDNKFKIFKTRDSITEFLDTGINSREDGQVDLFSHLKNIALDYPSFMRDEKDLEEMMKSLQTNMGIRKRFDYVIGNPPYVSYNECSKEDLEFIKKIKDKKDNSITLGNVYGVNLHSVPENPKKYPPKPNLYAFFIALGLALLKNNGKICYIIPQTILTEPDYDVLRYHLSKFTTIETIITFEGKLFVGRGLKQTKPIATSSLIFVARKIHPRANHSVEIINYNPYTEKQADDFEKYLNSRNKNKKTVPQTDLLKQFKNWNFIKQNDTFLHILENYQNMTDDLAIYYDHKLAKARFKDTFWFDVGFIIDKKYAQKEQHKTNDLALLTEYPNDGYVLSSFSQWYPFVAKKITLPKANQGLDSIDLPYKIIWQKGYGKKKFYYTDKSILLNMSDQLFIASRSKNEILYLFAILNNPITALILKNLFSVSNEKVGMFVGITRIKQNIRIPKVTPENEIIKDEIIKQTEAMLALENVKLKDIVDLSKVGLQKISEAYVKENKLALKSGASNISVSIQAGKVPLVKSLFADKKLFGDEIRLSSLKNMAAIDFDLQHAIKTYIDDLVFALYFNIKLPSTGINKRSQIKARCEKNEYYGYIYGATVE